MSQSIDSVAEMQRSPHFTVGYLAQELHASLLAMKTVRQPTAALRDAILNTERTIALYQAAYPNTKVGR